MIYDSHGRISIEGRRGSFYVHADYGLKPLMCRLGDVALGQRFKTNVDGITRYVVGQLIDDTTLVRPLPDVAGDRIEMNSGLVVTPVDEHGDPADHVKDDHPLGRVWRDHPAPEFETADLGDLIAALEDYRRRLES